MSPRRKFLKTSTTLIAGAVLLGTRPGRARATASTLDIALENASSSSQVYAYVTGTAIDQGNALFLLQADGRTPYYPAQPAAVGTPLAADCAIRLGGPGSTTRIVVPHLAGARVWFSIGAPLTFLLNPGGNGAALVEPSVTNPSDPNINTLWDFCEFTFNDAQLYANITYVDFVSLPIALSLVNAAGASQHVTGLPANGLAAVCNALRAQHAADGAGWDQLIVSPGGQPLRALSPNNGIVMNPSLFAGYFDGYVDQVWSKYAGTDLVVNTQAQWGTVRGRVAGDQLSFAGVGSFGRPSAADIFSCNSGPFAHGNDEMGALTARISAAFNRSTLLIDANQPDGENPANYYQNAVTNHYSRIVHAANADGRGYTFPYDDVTPSGGSDLSGAVADPNPSLWTITLNGP